MQIAQIDMTIYANSSQEYGYSNRLDRARKDAAGSRSNLFVDRQ